MKGNSIIKVENGKLLKVFLDYDWRAKSGSIRRIKITGDFFMHPEESIEQLEKELAGAKLERNVLLEKINDFFREKRIQLFGIDSVSLVTAIMNCTGEKG